jgi:hypothetical protein
LQQPHLRVLQRRLSDEHIVAVTSFIAQNTELLWSKPTAAFVEDLAPRITFLVSLPDNVSESFLSGTHLHRARLETVLLTIFGQDGLRRALKKITGYRELTDQDQCNTLRNLSFFATLIHNGHARLDDGVGLDTETAAEKKDPALSRSTYKTTIVPSQILNEDVAGLDFGDRQFVHFVLFSSVMLIRPAFVFQSIY